MKCALCSGAVDKRTKINGGCICSKCLSSYPESIRRHIRGFTAKQLAQASSAFRFASCKPWRRSGTFGLSEDAVQLNGFEYPLSRIKKIRLNFHPDSMGEYAGTVLGRPTVVIELAKPRLRIEEPFTDKDIKVRYHINGPEIHYFFSPALSRMVNEVNRAIMDGTYNLGRFQKELYEELHGRSSGQGSNRSRNQNRYQRQGYSRSYTRQGSTGRQAQNHGQPDLIKAKKRFGLDAPYTAEQVKKARNRILKSEKIHPDEGGSNEKFKILEEEYELLLKYAAS